MWQRSTHEPIAHLPCELKQLKVIGFNSDVIPMTQIDIANAARPDTRVLA